MSASIEVVPVRGSDPLNDASLARELAQRFPSGMRSSQAAGASTCTRSSCPPRCTRPPSVRRRGSCRPSVRGVARA